MRFLNSARGFSLLEILVAFSIAALALAMLYRVSGNNARQTGSLAQTERATALAQSLLAAYQTVPIAGLSDSGNSAGYGWSVESRPYPTPVNDQAPQAAHLYELLITVAWMDGTRSRSLELTTLRPERRAPQDPNRAQ